MAESMPIGPNTGRARGSGRHPRPSAATTCGEVCTGAAHFPRVAVLRCGAGKCLVCHAGHLRHAMRWPAALARFATVFSRFWHGFGGELAGFCVPKDWYAGENGASLGAWVSLLASCSSCREDCTPVFFHRRVACFHPTWPNAHDIVP